jgi:DNA translocase FtsK/SpoIIIE-like protein/SEFIR domain-containing protein
MSQLDVPISGERPQRVFISYAHEDDAHRGLVLRFAQLLRSSGIDARIDQFVEHSTFDWPSWMHAEITQADVVLCVASPSYKSRTEGTFKPPTGRGARWEGAILRDWIYDGLRDAGRGILGVVLPGGSAENLPYFLFPSSRTYYSIPALDLAGIETLLRRLTQQPSVTPYPIGEVPTLPTCRHDVTLSRDDFILPEIVSLSLLLGLSENGWSSDFWRRDTPFLESPIGLDTIGRPVSINLPSEGANIAVAGATGSGKTEAIFTVMLGLAVRNSPSYLQMLAITGKGFGFPFHVLGGLPHIKATYSIEEDSFGSVSDVIRQEMADRRRLLVERQCQDFDELWAKARRGSASQPPPYVLVIVEEWSYLHYDHPEVVETILRAAHQGRALGIQFLVGSQIPESLSSFPAHIRLALRMYDERGALEFAHVPISVPRIPGRAVLLRGGEQFLLQIAMSTTEELRRIIDSMRATHYITKEVSADPPSD